MKNRIKKFYHDHEALVTFAALVTTIGVVAIVANRYETQDRDLTPEEYAEAYRALNPELFTT